MSGSPVEQRLERALRYAAAASLALAGLSPGNNPDTLGHLAQGRQIAELGHVPATDTWSLLHAGRPWFNYEWLSDLLYYGLYAAFGYDALIALKCALLAGAVLLLLPVAARVGGPRASMLGALAFVAAIPALRFRLSDRPHVLGMVLAATYVAVLARLIDPGTPPRPRVRAGLVALVAGLHVLWVNLHGSHLLGVLITGMFAVFAQKSARRSVLALLGLEVLGSCISPWGPRIVTDALGHVVDPRYRALVTEWAAWDDNASLWLLVYPALCGALLALAAPRLLRSGPVARAALAVTCVLGVASFRSIRFVGEFLFLAAPWIGAGYAPALARLSTRGVSRAVTAAAVALGVLVPWGATQVKPDLPLGHGLSFDDLPHGPGGMLARAARPPRVFAAIQHSWPLMWEAPRARFFVDGRVPFYGPAHVATATAAFHDDAVFASVLREGDIDAVLLKHTLAGEQQRLNDLTRRPGWSLVLVDDAFALFVRDDLARISGFSAIRALVPGFGAEWVLAATPAQREVIAQEARTLARHDTARGFDRWTRALLLLAPFARDGGRGGLRTPEDAAGWAIYRRADALLTGLPESTRDLQTVAATRALVKAILCDTESGEAALAQSAAFTAEPSRESTLAAQELALRRGGRDAVRAFVEAGLALPQGRDDPWLRALREAVDRPPACPP